jgi:hypothetical protein
MVLHATTTHHLYAASTSRVGQLKAGHVPNPTQQDPASRLAGAVEDYRQHDNLGALFDALRSLARETTPKCSSTSRARIATCPKS